MVVAGISVAAILSHLTVRLGTGSASGSSLVPLYAGLFLGGTPALYWVFDRFVRGSFFPPLLEGAALATSVLRHWFVAATLLVALSALIGWLRGEGGAAFFRIVRPAASRDGQRLHRARIRLLSNCWLSASQDGKCLKRNRSIPR